jgi:PleD family two-component response regulator
MGSQTQLSGDDKTIILVVDRNSHICELESHFLNKAGYVVEFEQSGDSVVEHALKLHPEIIITEILVPGVDGLALCRQLKGDPRTRDIAVLIFSTLAAVVRAKEAGADAFLLKPLAEDALVATVRQVLEARRERLRSTQHEQRS